MTLPEIYLLHHSHYDRGFTHSQIVVDELQTDFIDQALGLLEATRDWDECSQPRWTIEVHQQLKLWLASATPESIGRMKHFADGGRVGLGAARFNTTPLGCVESLCRQLADVPGYRREFGFPVKVAMQHDVTGIPWVMSDLLLDSGVELLIMGVNLHTSDNGPVRPGMFRWQTPSGRELLVFSGHQYCTFDLVARPHVNTVDQMKAAMDGFWEDLCRNGYPHDFLYLTSTNLPVAYDNGGPSMQTARMVREWNARKDFPKIRFVTPEQLLERLKQVPGGQIGTHSGDWSDFWNYGAGSTSRETSINAGSKRKLFGASLLGAHLPPNARIAGLHREAWEHISSYEEHTWGFWASASSPDHPQSVTTELRKRCMAHDGQELARYVLASALSESSGNPSMGPSEGLLAFNPSPLPMAVAVDLPAGWKDTVFGRLNGFAHAHSEPLTHVGGEGFSTALPGGERVFLELEPYGELRLPWADCTPPPPAEGLKDASVQKEFLIQALDGDRQVVRLIGNRTIESPHHLLEYHPDSGRIIRLLDKRTGWEVLPKGAEYDLFEPVHEKPDPRFDASRKSYYDRSVEAEMRLETTGWNEDWRAVRSGANRVGGVRVEQGERTIHLVRECGIEGAPGITQRFGLSADHPWIEVETVINKDRCVTPEAIYFASQLNLAAGWEAVYDSSGIPVRLDEEQLDRTSNGWVTSLAFSRMSDGENQFSVFAPGMPLVQFGGFHFGKPMPSIPRPADPLFLNWACNNYWETNFPVTQEGVIRHRCAIHTSRNESDARTYRLADAFAATPMLLPLSKCGESSSRSLLGIDNPDVRIASVTPGEETGQWNYRLVNPGREPQTCTLDLKRACSFAITSPCGEVLRSSESADGKVTVDLPARSVVSVSTRQGG